MTLAPPGWLYAESAIDGNPKINGVQPVICNFPQAGRCPKCLEAPDAP